MKETICKKCLGSGELEDLELVNGMFVPRGFIPCEFCNGHGYKKASDETGKFKTSNSLRKAIFGWVHR
jgi:excinuclease UvrABC ATPase subunit